MRPLVILLAVFLISALPTGAAFGQLSQREALLRAAETFPFRIWFDDTGKHQTVAKYLRHDKQSVTIMKENKLVLVIPFTRLSERDHNYIESFGTEQASTLLPTIKTTGRRKQPNPSQSDLSADGEGSEFEALMGLGELPRIEMPSVQQAIITHEGLRKPLAKKNYQKVRATLNRLSKGWPSESTAELADAVALCSSSGNFSIDEAALTLLLKSDPHRHFDVFKRIVDRQDFDLRMIAYQGLAAINDERSLKLLLRKFKSQDQVFIGKLLPEFGNRAETLLHEHLRDMRADHVLVTVSVLSEIGTQRSIPALTDLAKESDKVAIRQQATTALKRVEERLTK